MVQVERLFILENVQWNNVQIEKEKTTEKAFFLIKPYIAFVNLRPIFRRLGYTMEPSIDAAELSKKTIKSNSKKQCPNL